MGSFKLKIVFAIITYCVGLFSEDEYLGVNTKGTTIEEPDMNFGFFSSPSSGESAPVLKKDKPSAFEENGLFQQSSANTDDRWQSSSLFSIANPRGDANADFSGPSALQLYPESELFHTGGLNLPPSEIKEESKYASVPLTEIDPSVTSDRIVSTPGLPYGFSVLTTPKAVKRYMIPFVKLRENNSDY